MTLFLMLASEMTIYAIGINKTSKSNMENIIYIKDVFPKLLTKKINNIINNKMSQAKSKINIIIKVLQLRNLSVGLGEEPCIGFTQENSMENSLQELSLLIYVVTLVCATTILLLS